MESDGSIIDDGGFSKGDRCSPRHVYLQSSRCMKSSKIRPCHLVALDRQLVQLMNLASLSWSCLRPCIVLLQFAKGNEGILSRALEFCKRYISSIISILHASIVQLPNSSHSILYWQYLSKHQA